MGHLVLFWLLFSDCIFLILSLRLWLKDFRDEVEGWDGVLGSMTVALVMSHLVYDIVRIYQG